MVERSLTVNVKARVSSFLGNMRSAGSETVNLGRKMTETGASADRMRKRLEAATKALPKIEIDADSSPAEIKFAKLRADLETLASKKIGVDVDSASASAQIQEIERELEKLARTETSVHVKADIGTALTELRAIQGEANRLNQTRANVQVNADVAGALSSIAMVGAALAALPAVTAIAASVTVLGGAFAAAGVGAAGFAAVAGPSLGRINEALKEQESAAGGAGAATKSAAQAAAEAAQKAMSLEQAERRVTDAKKSAKAAEEDLTRARRDAKRAIQDMNLSLKDAVLSEEDAALAIEEARLRMNEVNADPEATDLERKRAELSYRQALQRMESQQVATQRLSEDTKKANKAGVEGSDQVVAAKERQAKAAQALVDAEKQLRLLLLQQKAAMEQAGGAAGGAASKMSKLTKEEQKLAKEIKTFKDTYLEWQQSLQPDVFPAISGGMALITSQLPKWKPLVKGAAGAFVELERDAKKALEDPFWDTFYKNLEQQIPGAITKLGQTGGNVFKGFAGVLNAFLPHTGTLLDRVVLLSQKFADWGVNLGGSSAFAQFMNRVKTDGPVVWETLKNVAITVGNVAEAVGPLTIASLGGLSLLAKLTAGMSPGDIQLVALAIAAVYGAVKAGQTVNAGLEALSLLRRRIDDAGGAANGVKGKLGGVMSLLGAGGPWGAAIGVGITALGLFGLAQAEARREVDELAGALDQQTGAITKSAREQAKSALREDGTVDAAKKLGINLNDLTEASLGNEDAIKRVNAQLAKHKVDLTGANAKAGAFAYGQKGLKEEAYLVGEAINGQNEKLADARQLLADNAAMDGIVFGAQEKLNKSYKDAKQAISDANGQLDASKAKTDAQRQAIETARTAWDTHLRNVRDTAKAQADLSGKQEDGRTHILNQLEPLMRLAGGNKAAKDEVYKLAEQYGISKTMADKAAKGGKDLRDVLAQLKNKTVHIDANTSKADAAIGKIIKTLEKTYVIGVDVRSDRQEHGNRASANADGNLWMRPGKVMAFAGGSENHVAQIGRPGEIRIWNEPETAGESYIPHALSKRARSMDILKATAAKFGQQVVPMASSTSTLMSGSSNLGSATSTTLTVNLDNADAVVVSLDNTTRAMQAGLSSASSTLTSAMGSSGTLTTAVGELGSAASVLGDSLSDAVSDLAAEMRALTSAISSLRSAVSATSSAAATKTSSTSTSSTSTKPSSSAASSAASVIKKNAQALLNKSQAGYVGSTGGSSGPAQKSGASSLIKGSGPSSNAGVLVVPMANGGLVTSPTILAGEAGREMVVPLSPAKRAQGVATLSAAADIMGLSVGPRLSSTPSMPRYSRSPGSLSAPSGGVSEAQMATLLRHIERLASRPTIGTVNAPPGCSVDELAERLNFKADARG